MSNNLKAIVITHRKHADFHRVCGKWLSDIHVSIHRVLLPSVLDRVEAQGEDLVLIDRAMPVGQQRTAEVWAKGCVSFDWTWVDSRSPNDVSVDRGEFGLCWSELRKTVQRILNKIPAPPVAVGPKPHRDERRVAVNMKGVAPVIVRERFGVSNVAPVSALHSVVKSLDVALPEPQEASPEMVAERDRLLAENEALRKPRVNRLPDAVPKSESKPSLAVPEVIVEKPIEEVRAEVVIDEVDHRAPTTNAVVLWPYKNTGIAIGMGADNFVDMTAMWRANEKPENREPAKYLRTERAKALIEQITRENAAVLFPHGALHRTESGGVTGGGCTKAQWKLALDYGMYLNAEFHSWCLDHIGKYIAGGGHANPPPNSIGARAMRLLAEDTQAALDQEKAEREAADRALADTVEADRRAADTRANRLAADHDALKRAIQFPDKPVRDTSGNRLLPYKIGKNSIAIKHRVWDDGEHYVSFLCSHKSVPSFGASRGAVAAMFRVFVWDYLRREGGRALGLNLMGGRLEDLPEQALAPMIAAVPVSLQRASDAVCRSFDQGIGPCPAHLRKYPRGNMRVVGKP